MAFILGDAWYERVTPANIFNAKAAKGANSANIFGSFALFRFIRAIRVKRVCGDRSNTGCYLFTDPK